jgi:hypothetical protein
MGIKTHFRYDVNRALLTTLDTKYQIANFMFELVR